MIESSFPVYNYLFTSNFNSLPNNKLNQTESKWQNKCSYTESFLKTLSVKEKMQATSIFCFSHYVFYPAENKNFNFSDSSICYLEMLSV